MIAHIKPDASNPGRVIKFISRFLRGNKGGVAIYVALVSTIMLGFGALVIDLGRLFTLHTELQSAADAAALAGAAELDSTAGSITRARSAAKASLITNRQTFAVGSPNITISDENIRFLFALPASDDDPVTDSHLTNLDRAAVFIEVKTTVHEVSYVLAPALAARIGGDGTAPQSGQGIGGRGRRL